MRALQQTSIGGLQVPTIPLQSTSLPATTTATQWTDLMNTMVPAMMMMIMMVMMMKQMEKVY
jgi:hypothetical protein